MQMAVDTRAISAVLLKATIVSLAKNAGQSKSSFTPRGNSSARTITLAPSSGGAEA